MDFGGLGRARSSARRALTTRSNWASKILSSSSQPLKLGAFLHVLWLDGVYAWQPGRSVEWCPHEIVRDADVSKLVKRIRDRVVRCLRQLGKWPDEGEEPEVSGEEEQLLLELGSAAVQGRAALGERAGARDARPGRGSRDEPFVKAPLCADVDGFSLHAGVRVPAGDRERLEKLCRYAGRPAIAESRLSLLPDGRVAYELKRRWNDGTTHVVLEPQVLLERLVALIPRPRRHLVTYHGVLAPAAGLRSQIVPRVEDKGEGEGCRHAAGDASDSPRDGGAIADEATCRLMPRRVVPHAPGKRRRGGRRRYSWAELLRRVFEIDVLVCPSCGGRRKVLSAIHDPDSIARVLGALGLSSEVPELAPARGPPEEAEWWGA